MNQKHYSDQNYDPSMNYYGQSSDFSSKNNGDYYNKHRYDKYESNMKYMPSKVYQGKRESGHYEYHQGPYPIVKESPDHTATYHYGRTANTKMDTASVPSNYIQSTRMQMPFSLNEDSHEAHHQSSSLFRSASTKMSPIMPSLPLDELSPNRRAAAGLLSKNMIPVPEEEDGMIHRRSHNYGMEEPLRHPIAMQQKQAGPSKMMLPGDSSMNYTPFGGGTYFGPTVLNKYGDTSDFFTPQAKQLRPRNYAAVPGDASAKNYSRQGKKPNKNSDQNSQAGFSMLASNIIRGQDQDEHNE
jgi:hypothetical protein